MPVCNRKQEALQLVSQHLSVVRRGIFACALVTFEPDTVERDEYATANPRTMIKTHKPSAM